MGHEVAAVARGSCIHAFATSLAETVTISYNIAAQAGAGCGRV
jgi:hypothetical protein